MNSEDLSNFGQINDENSSSDIAHNLTIEFLNDDCMIHIFQYLTVTERIRIEAVSKNWNRVAKLSWISVKSIQFHKILPYGINANFQLSETLQAKNIAYLKKVFQRCGTYLKELNIYIAYCIKFLKINQLLNLIHEYCNNINKVQLRHSPHDTPIPLLLNENLKNLIEKNQSINCISLESFPFIDCFLKLNVDAVKEIYIQNEFGINSNQFNHSHGVYYGILANLKNLNKFSINDKPDIIAQAINALIISKCQNIFKACLTLSSISIINNLSLFLSKQQKIHELILCNVLVDQSFLDELPSNNLEIMILRFSKSPIPKIFLNISSFLSKQRSIRKLILENVGILETLTRNQFQILPSTSLEKLVLEFDEIPSEEMLLHISLFLSKQRKLRKLKLRNVLINKKLIESQVDGSLEEIYVEFSNTQTGDNALNISLFLSKHKKLQKLEIYYVYMDDKFIKNLPSEYLQIFDTEFENIENSSWDIILKHFDHFKNLKILIAVFKLLTDDHLQKLTNYINENIKVIEITFYEYLPSTKQTSNFNFKKLKNLESFVISNLGNNNPDANNILRNLSQCENLRRLKLNFSTVGLNDISCIPNLRILELEFAENEDNEFLLFIQKLLTLQVLKLEGCSNITNNLIKKASDIKVQRGDKEILKIFFDDLCPKIDYPDLKNEPLIIIDYIYNYCYE